MSPLQLGLLAIGALVITSVVLYNWWQERTIRRDMVRRFDGPIDDVLMGKSATDSPDAEDAFAIDMDPVEHEAGLNDERDAEMEHEAAEESESEMEAESEWVEPAWKEPEFTASEPDEVDEESEPEPALEPDFDEAALLRKEDDDELPMEEEVPTLAMAEEDEITVEDEPDAEPEESIALDAEPATSLPNDVDTQVDEIAIITLDAPSTGAAVYELLESMADVGKPVRWFGASSGVWLPLAGDYAQRSFFRIVGALQLADRSGAIEAKGLADFQNQVVNLSKQLGGEVSWQQEREAAEYAQALDQFCIEVDVTVTLHLAAGISGPFAGTKLRSLMEASGLTLKQDGRFHFANEGGETVFIICNSDQSPLSEESLRTSQLPEVLLMLDVPRAADASNVFKQMAMLGNRMETALNAKLTDARQRALGDAEIEQIRSQIKALHAKMQERGLIPGSASVLRLFS